MLGVLGGFAPEGITDFLSNLIMKAADSENRADVRIIADYKIGGLGEGTLPVGKEQQTYEKLLESARTMERAGADYLVIPCIEAHYYIRRLKSEIGAELIDALDCTGRFLKGNKRRDSTVGVLASSDAINAGIFKEYLSDFRLIYPPKDIQDNLVMEAINNKRGIKTEETIARSRKLLKDAAGYLIYMGAQLLVSGSSEISVVLRQEHVGVCMVDPMKILLDTVLDLIKSEK
ncbi:MAG: hypothetical protein HPY66_1339 [Firmicutes bacterium]|nr:hypothetical protein [Bacillota bacterium]